MEPGTSSKDQEVFLVNDLFCLIKQELLRVPPWDPAILKDFFCFWKESLETRKIVKNRKLMKIGEKKYLIIEKMYLST